MHMEGDGPQDQPAEGVTLDSIAALMGDEAEETTPDDAAEGEAADESEEVEAEEADSEGEDEGEEPTFTIKHDGKEVALKQSELIEMAQQGFDYTKKTMAVAEERKAIEPIKRQAEEFRQQQQAATEEAIARLEAYSKVIERDVGDPPPISLAQQNAAHYLALKEQHEAKKGQLQQALSEIRALKEQSHRQRQAALDAKAESTLKALADTPGWSDGELSSLQSYIKANGITPDAHADTFVELGLWEMARKARAYDALQAQKATLKPAAKVRPVQKPGTTVAQPPQLAQRQQAIKAHKARPTVETLANLL
jgi:hypothetical protein